MCGSRASPAAHCAGGGTGRAEVVIAAVAVGPDLDRLSVGRCVDHQPVAEVEADVMDAGGGAVEDEVARDGDGVGRQGRAGVVLGCAVRGREIPAAA